jgi:hypothetical protein
MLSFIFQFWFTKIMSRYGLFLQIWNIKTQEALKFLVYSSKTKLFSILHSKNRKKNLQKKIQINWFKIQKFSKSYKK